MSDSGVASSPNQHNRVLEIRQALREDGDFGAVTGLNQEQREALSALYSSVNSKNATSGYSAASSASVAHLQRVCRLISSNTVTSTANDDADECVLCRAAKLLRSKLAPRLAQETYNTKQAIVVQVRDKDGQITSESHAMHKDCLELARNEDCWERPFSDRVLFGAAGAGEDWTLAQAITDLFHATQGTPEAKPDLEQHAIDVQTDRVSVIFNEGRNQQAVDMARIDFALSQRFLPDSAGNYGGHVPALAPRQDVCGWCLRTFVELGLPESELPNYYTAYKCQNCNVHMHKDCMRDWHQRGAANGKRQSMRVVHAAGKDDEDWTIEGFRPSSEYVGF
jgi:hypothetical protein